ncbi:GNAT family N-acetyltransferase [Chitinophaga sp. 212800010-3]|uniref:GNAT family N-acetyltransferase n=1 Tax=unclassified Chitinophaga TaxID=2619133 RepID=UPI002DE95C1F|nr:Ribosomal-protein-alanine N-acetyltransferase [Chitinophaga sp. 212800010-3]
MPAFKFESQPALFTPRFHLRSARLEDDAAIAAMRSDPRVNEFLERPGTTTIEQARQHIEKVLAGFANMDSLYWVISPKENDQLLGIICLWNIVPALNRAEIGYELRSECWGNKIIQEVMPEVIRFGFEEMKLEKIIALSAVANIRSAKLLEGQQFVIDEALKKELEPEGEHCYSRTR